MQLLQIQRFLPFDYFWFWFFSRILIIYNLRTYNTSVTYYKRWDFMSHCRRIKLIQLKQMGLQTIAIPLIDLLWASDKVWLVYDDWNHAKCDHKFTKYTFFKNFDDLPMHVPDRLSCTDCGYIIFIPITKTYLNGCKLGDSYHIAAHTKQGQNLKHQKMNIRLFWYVTVVRWKFKSPYLNCHGYIVHWDDLTCEIPPRDDR